MMQLPVSSSLRLRGAESDLVRARFVRTYREERAFVAGVVRRQGVPLGDVDDAVQDVFALLHARLPGLDDRAPLRAWLKSVAIRMSQNRRRKVQRQRTAVDASGGAYDPDGLSDASQSLPDEGVVRVEEREAIHRALCALDDSKREVLVLTVFEERTALEIAGLMATSPNTVSSRLRAARERLADQLAPVRQPASVRPARVVGRHASACQA